MKNIKLPKIMIIKTTDAIENSKPILVRYVFATTWFLNRRISFQRMSRVRLSLLYGRNVFALALIAIM